MSHRNFEKPDRAEHVEKVEKPEKTEGKEKETLLSKAKQFFAEHGKGREGKESKENKEDVEKRADQREEKTDEKGDSFKERLRAGVPTREQQAESAKKYREAHGLDEHGNSLDKNAKRPDGGYERERGDEGPRSRWDSANEGKEDKEKTAKNPEKNADDE